MRSMDCNLKIRSNDGCFYFCIDENESIYNDAYIKLVNRKTKNFIYVDLIKSRDNKLKGMANIEKNKEIFNSKFIDIYIKDNEGTKRITTNGENLKAVVPVKKLGYYYEAYKTQNNNVSIRKVKMTEKAYIENIVVSESGIEMSGFIVDGRLDLSKEDVTMNLVLKVIGEEDESSINLKPVYREDIKNKYTLINSNLGFCGFEANASFKELNNVHKNKKMVLHIEAISNGVVRKVQLGLADGIQKNCLDVELDIKNKEKMFLKESKNRVEILITDKKQIAQCNKIFIQDGNISIEHNLRTSKSDDVKLLMKNRRTLNELFIDCEIKHTKKILVFNMNDLIKSSAINPDIYDLFIVKNDVRYRIANWDGDIADKQGILTYPTTTCACEDERLISYKPYYTIHNEVSILVSEYMELKSLEYVKKYEDKISISMKVKTPSIYDELDEEVLARLHIKATYSRKFEIPVRFKVKKVKENSNEYILKTSINSKKAKVVGADLNDIIKNIDFDLVRCKFNFNDGFSEFLINVPQSKIHNVNSKQNIISKGAYTLLDSKKLGLYKRFNGSLPIDENLAIFQSFHGKNYSCSSKAIYEELIKERPDIKCVWVLYNKNKDIPGNPIIVRPNSVEYYYYMARAKYFINNGNFPDFYEKREGTVHLQLWHGTPLKRIGKHISEDSPAYYENNSEEFEMRNARWDYLLTPNRYTEDILKEAFSFNKETLPYGYPRNDVLVNYNENKVVSIKEKLGIPKDKKVILFAPTWRDSDYHGNKRSSEYEFKFNIDEFVNKFKDEYVLALRLHNRDADRIRISGYDDVVFNLSSYDDIQELYLISDLLITDYSSVMFDYANLKRPMIFFTHDIDEYSSEVRGFYFDFEKEAPGPIVKDENELFNSIENLEKIKLEYDEKYKKFTKKFCEWENGTASKRVIEKIFE